MNETFTYKKGCDLHGDDSEYKVTKQVKYV